MILGIATLLLLGAIGLAFGRLLRGPTAPDRVLALDLMALAAIGLLAAYALETGRAAYLDVAAVLALLSFLGTVALATYIERTSAERALDVPPVPDRSARIQPPRKELP